MSYSRRGEGSDLYIWRSSLLHCDDCPLHGGANFECATSAEMLAHVMAHGAAGHAVTQEAQDRLTREAAWEARVWPPPTPQSAPELGQYIRLWRDRIFVRAYVGGAWGSYALTQLPEAQANDCALRFLAEGRIPALLKPEDEPE